MATKGRTRGLEFLSKSGSTPCETLASSSQLLVGVDLVGTCRVYYVEVLYDGSCVVVPGLYVEGRVRSEPERVEVLPVASQYNIVRRTVCWCVGQVKPWNSWVGARLDVASGLVGQVLLFQSRLSYRPVDAGVEPPSVFVW